MSLKVAILLILISITYFLKAEVHLNEGKDIYYVTRDLDFLIDKNQSLTIDDLSRGSHENEFLKDVIPYIEVDHDYTYWGRLKIINNRVDTLNNVSWYFESFGFDIDEFEFYIPRTDGSFLKKEMGFFMPFDYRGIYHKNLVFFLDLRPGESKTYFLKFKRRYPMRLNFIIRTNELFIRHAVIEYVLLGFFYGVLGFIILINSYLFFSLKDKIYLYYLFVVLSEVLYCLGRDGLGFQFLWPSKPWINVITHHNVTQYFFVVTSIVYAIHFLKLKLYYRKIYYLAVLLIAIRAVLFIIWQFYPIPPFQVFILDAIILTLPFISGILSLLAGKEYTRYYVLAFSFLYLSFLFIILDERQFLPSFFKIGWYLINIGMFLEALLLAIAMIDQIRVFKRDKESVQKELIKQLHLIQQIKDEAKRNLEIEVNNKTIDILTYIDLLNDKNNELGKSQQG